MIKILKKILKKLLIAFILLYSTIDTEKDAKKDANDKKRTIEQKYSDLVAKQIKHMRQLSESQEKVLKLENLIEMLIQKDEKKQTQDKKD